jgi:crotonobetainyl-CoA:carnitine CoA-transferase CaiB-like acyl-CoA transferase
VRADHSAPPTRPVAGMGDHPSAVTLYAAITTALYRRERSGLGGLVSTSLMANGLWANGVQVQGQLSGAVFPLRQGRENAPNPLSNLYRCSDQRWLSLVVLNEARQLPLLLQAIGLAQLADDPRLASAAARALHSAELIALFDAQFAQHDLASWRARLDAAGVTFGVVGTLADLPGDAQMLGASALVPFAHHAGLTLPSPLQLRGVAQRPAGPAPALGQHSAAVLQEAGFTAEQIARLIDSQVVFNASTPPATTPLDTPPTTRPPPARRLE